MAQWAVTITNTNKSYWLMETQVWVQLLILSINGRKKNPPYTVIVLGINTLFLFLKLTELEKQVCYYITKTNRKKICSVVQRLFFPPWHYWIQTPHFIIFPCNKNNPFKLSRARQSLIVLHASHDGVLFKHRSLKNKTPSKPMLLTSNWFLVYSTKCLNPSIQCESHDGASG